MQMTDILPVDEWAKLEQEITQRFGVNAHAYDAKGSPFTGAATWPTRLCVALRQNKGAASGICSVINQTLVHEVGRTGRPAVTDCDAGQLVVCAPVVVEGELVGMVGGCGGFADDNEPETFLLEKMADLSEERVAELCQGGVRMSADEVQAMSDWIAARVDAIVKDFQARGK
jgi:ligand-binding sensor protein